MKEEYIKLGLAFQVPQEISDKAIVISKELASKHKAKFVLDGQNFHPHITIYPPHYPAKNLPQVIEKVEDVIKEGMGLVQMTFTKVESKNGYIAIYFKLTPEIKKIHKNLVKALNPLREGYINPKYGEPTTIKRFTKKELENIKSYGYPYTMDFYRHPHLSLIRLEDAEEAKASIKEVERDIKEFDVNKLILHRIGENGGAVEIIKEFNL